VEKVIRIWSGCRVICIVAVSNNGGSWIVTDVGGAGNSSNPTIEIDPFAGLIVDHETSNSPLDFRSAEE